MKAEDNIHLKPIGYVETNFSNDEIARRRRSLISDIVIAAEYRDALTGIEAYSHLIVIFWMSEQTPSANLLAHPRGNESLPLTGVLAMRGRSHPNPIGVAVVELCARTATRLTVRRLDAYDGTQIVDIKPYDQYDVYPEPRVPQWFRTALSRS